METIITIIVVTLGVILVRVLLLGKNDNQNDNLLHNMKLFDKNQKELKNDHSRKN